VLIADLTSDVTGQQLLVLLCYKHVVYLFTNILYIYLQLANKYTCCGTYVYKFDLY